jgi:ribonuclease HII
MPDFVLEISVAGKKGRVAGVDEVGRGPWAGPVVAAAAVLEIRKLPKDLLDRIDDSKALTVKRREAVAAELVARALAKDGVVVALGSASVTEIDRFNILRASERAMLRALSRLPFAPDHVLVDGNRIPPEMKLPARAVIGGDGRSLSIAAASIVAKVTRDRMCAVMHCEEPHYGFDSHKGYSAPAHFAALDAHGPGRYHRMDFAPCIEAANRSRVAA